MIRNIVSICVAALGAALTTAAPAQTLAFGWRAQAVSAGYENLLHKAVYDWELFDEGAVLYYDDENYCWQQVWTVHGWRWVDVCYGYVF